MKGALRSCTRGLRDLYSPSQGHTLRKSLRNRLGLAWPSATKVCLDFSGVPSVLGERRACFVGSAESFFDVRSDGLHRKLVAGRYTFEAMQDARNAREYVSASDQVPALAIEVAGEDRLELLIRLALKIIRGLRSPFKCHFEPNDIRPQLVAHEQGGCAEVAASLTPSRTDFPQLAEDEGDDAAAEKAGHYCRSPTRH